MHARQGLKRLQVCKIGSVRETIGPDWWETTNIESSAPVLC